MPKLDAIEVCIFGDEEICIVKDDGEEKTGAIIKLHPCQINVVCKWLLEAKAEIERLNLQRSVK